MKSKLLSRVMVYAGLLFAGSSLAQVIPTPSFVMSTNTICTEGSVQITDVSTDVPTAWSYSVNGVATSTAASPELTFTVSGTYSIDLEASNAAGTSVVYSNTLLVQPLPTITVSGNTLVCTSASSTLGAVGADTYSWSVGATTDSITINPASNITYTLVGTSTLTGCSDSNFVSITTVPLPTISVSNATICAGEVYTLAPTGGSTYSYSGGSNTISPLSNTNYTVSGTDALTGCSDSVVVSINVNSVSLSSNSGSVCAGESFTIVTFGATTYTYSGGSNVVSPVTNTTYTVSGTDVTTGCTGTLAVTIGIKPSPTISLNTGSICAGSVFTIVPSGATNYTYSTGSNTVIPVANMNYVVSGVSAVTGCIGSATLTLTINPMPVIAVNSGTICAGDVFTISPSGAFTYTLSSGTDTVAPVTSTNYSVTGTSSAGCVSQAAVVSSVVVSGIRPTVIINSSSTGMLCSGESVTLTAIGATSYSWNNGATTASVVITPTVTTLFNVIGLDQLSGCSSATSTMQYVYDCTGLENTSANIRFNVYPNPTSGDLKISVSGDVYMSASDAFGKLVLNQQLTAGENTLQLNGLPEGFYFITFTQGNEQKTIKIIKQ